MSAIFERQNKEAAAIRELQRARSSNSSVASLVQQARKQWTHATTPSNLVEMSFRERNEMSQLFFNEERDRQAASRFTHVKLKRGAAAFHRKAPNSAEAAHRTQRSGSSRSSRPHSAAVLQDDAATCRLNPSAPHGTTYEEDEDDAAYWSSFGGLTTSTATGASCDIESTARKGFGAPMADAVLAENAANANVAHSTAIAHLEIQRQARASILDALTLGDSKDPPLRQTLQFQTFSNLWRQHSSPGRSPALPASEPANFASWDGASPTASAGENPAGSRLDNNTPEMFLPHSLQPHGSHRQASTRLFHQRPFSASVVGSTLASGARPPYSGDSGRPSLAPAARTEFRSGSGSTTAVRPFSAQPLRTASFALSCGGPSAALASSPMAEAPSYDRLPNMLRQQAEMKAENAAKAARYQQTMESLADRQRHLNDLLDVIAGNSVS